MLKSKIEIQLEKRGWKSLWHEDELQRFSKTAKFSFLLSGIGYIIHFFIVERSQVTDGLEKWAYLRFSVAALCLGAGVFYSKQSLLHSRWFKAPALVASMSWIFAQVVVMYWEPRVPFLFSAAFPVLFIWILQLSFITSVALAVAVYAAQFVLLYDYISLDPNLLPVAVSSYMFGLVAVASVRFEYFKSIQAFVAKQTILEERRKTIEAQHKLVEQTRSFLPAQIFQRIMVEHERNGHDLLLATEKVLTPQKRHIFCIYTDIRNFSKQSADIDYYLMKEAVPEIQAIADLAESYGGIPRLVGDLVLVYFDYDEIDKNAELALKCAHGIAQLNQTNNASRPESLKVSRFVIVSAGACVVGNIGGTNSAREITCLGPSVNLLQRIDEITKAAAFQKAMSGCDVILTSSAYELTRVKFDFSNIVKVGLEDMQLRIRSFPDEKLVYGVRFANEKKSSCNSQKAS